MSLTIPPARIVEESGSPLLAARDSWERRPLGEVATTLNGFAFKSKEFVPAGGKPLIRIRDIFNEQTAVGYDGQYDSRYLVQPGDFLVGMDGDFNCARWRGPEALLNQRVCKITPDPEHLDLDFLVHLLPGYLQAIHDLTSSTTVTHLSSRDIAQIPIPVPPVEEQRELARLFEVAASKQQSSSGHLVAARRAIERFRQAVLTAACSGRLTADWRASNAHSASIEALVRHIHHLRSAPPREGKPPKPKPPAGAFPLDVPNEWASSSLDALTIRITSGSRDWSRYYGRGTGTFVMAQNVRPGRLDWSYRQAVDPPVDDQSRSRSQIEVGDLLATIVGANTGDAGPVTSPQPEHYVCQSVALIRPVDPALTPFLNLWFGSPGHGRGYFDSCLYGAGRPHLSFGQLRSAPVAVPSAAEQEEIVRRVEELYSLADTLESRLDAARTRIDRTSYAVLAKAFRSELAAQEPRLVVAEALLS